MFAFGNKDYTNNYGIYGAPTEFDGHVPGAFATWVNGLEAGTYYLRAWINGYVQTDASGNYVDYEFSVASQEWAGDIYTPMDLQLSGYIVKTVHFQFAAGTMKEIPAWVGDGQGAIIDPWRFLILEARDAAGTLVAFNFTMVDANATQTTLQLNGFGMAGPVVWDPEPNAGMVDHDVGRWWDAQAAPWHHWTWNERPTPRVAPAAEELGEDKDYGMKFFLYKYRHIRDYGLMPGTYKIYAYMRGFVEQEFEMASVSLSGAPTYISDHLYLGGGINITLYSIDWEHPRVDREWLYPRSGDPWDWCGWITVNVLNSEDINFGTLFFYNNVGDAGFWLKPWQVAGELSWPFPGIDGDYGDLKFHGAVNLERFGPEETIGLYTSDANDEMGTLWEDHVLGLGFLYSPWVYRDDDFNTKVGLETDNYHFEAHTYGYVLKEPEKYTLFVAKGTQGDTKLNLMQGIAFDYTIIFKKEGLIEHLPYDMFIQVMFLDEDGNVVGNSWPGWEPPVSYRSTIIPPGYQSPPNHYSVEESTIMIDGHCAGIADCWDSWGIDGYPNYLGDYSVIVTTAYTLPDGKGPDGIFLTGDEVYYPPPPGILMGFWGDGPVSKWGPYEMRTEVTIPNVHLGGTASIEFELDQRALLTGQIAGFTWSNELRPASWASVMVSGEAGDLTVWSYDGLYELYAPRGDYDMTIEAFSGDAGYYSQTVSVTAPDGGAASYNFLNMERSGIAIPEFTTVAVSILAALGASLYVFRRKAKK
jgi:hypothetical protein